MKKTLIIALAMTLPVLTIMACGNKAQKEAEQTVVEVSADEAPRGSNIGDLFIDIALPNEAGETIAVSDFVAKNKYVLVDFWASWCGPCRREMPSVVAAYEAFRDKGLEVVGVSLDADADAWTGAVKALGMTWPQMSDLKGWDCKGAELYGVRSIPSNVLIRQDGIIVAKDLRGQQLMEVMAELMK